MNKQEIYFCQKSSVIFLSILIGFFKATTITTMAFLKNVPLVVIVVAFFQYLG